MRPGDREGRGPAHGHHRALTRGRPHRHAAAPVSDPLSDRAAQPQPGGIHPGRVEARTRVPHRDLDAAACLHAQGIRVRRARAWRARAQSDRHPGLSGPGVGGHVGQRLPGGVHDGRGHRPRDVRLASPGYLEGYPQAAGPHLAGHRLDVGDQSRACGRGRLRGPGGVREGVLQQRDVVPAPGHHHRPAAPAADGGQRVQHGVVQQALVFAPLDVPGQDDVLVMRFGVRGGEPAVGLRGPVVEHAAAGPVDDQHDEQQHTGHHRGVTLGRARRRHRGTGPVGRLRDQAQQHREHPGREPDRHHDLADQNDVEPVAGHTAHLRRYADPGTDRERGVKAAVGDDQRPSRAAPAQVGRGGATPGHRGHGPGEIPRVSRVVVVPDDHLHDHINGRGTTHHGCDPRDHRPDHGHGGPGSTPFRRGKPACRAYPARNVPDGTAQCGKQPGRKQPGRSGAQTAGPPSAA